MCTFFMSDKWVILKHECFILKMCNPYVQIAHKEPYFHLGFQPEENGFRGPEEPTFVYTLREDFR